MAALFKEKAPKVEAPKPVRMPAETDPEILEASQRTRSAALKRKGRLSTLLTDSTRQIANPERVMTGSSGVKLGA